MQTLSQDQARAFRTARFTDEALAFQNRLPIVPVRIAFLYVAYNAYHRRNECLFSCYRDEEHTDLICTYYQNALTDFHH